MILYFSGTGNSEYVAKRIGEEVQDQVCNLFEKIREQDFTKMHSESPWVIVVPTYAWRIPRIVESWLKHTPLKGSANIYFVMTCGNCIGNAGAYLNELCKIKKLHLLGCASIVMPENYIALFNAPNRSEALAIIDQAESKISDVAQHIKSHNEIPKSQEPPITFRDRISSGFVNDIYYPLIVRDKKFYAMESCIACGKCEKVCPLKNIRLKNGRPFWGGHCTHCMACINRCPKEAIEYGNHSKGLVRYVCPKV